MQQRQPELQRFLVSLHNALRVNTDPDSPARDVTERIMSALKTVASPTHPDARQFSVCDLLEEAVHGLATSHDGEGGSVLPDANEAAPASSTLKDMTASSSSVVEHAQSMLALSDSFAWWQRPGADEVGEPFKSGHANSIVIGPGGLEERDDVWVGVSLLAPGIDYPVHHHPPEEVYLVLSEGQWNQNNGPWQEPGVGGVVHNPPNILHSMRSGEKPLLATWCLWIG